MSKKTRKKTPGKTAKTSSGKKASSSKASRGESVTSAKTTAAKARATANKSATTKESAKSPRAKAAAPRPAARKATVPKATASNKAGAEHPSASQPQRPKAAPAADGKSALAEGAKAPAFRLPRDGGEAISLADFSGQKLVLFFYPRADTPGCTKEAIDFTRLKDKFAESRTAILGISADPPKAQAAFRDTHQLSIPLISDEQHQMLEAYGVWGEKSMYGKTFQGIFRTTVLIGADGRIIKIWHNVKVDGHADEVLAAAGSV
jgi:thioredoxin-dependent peroxiredoxin